MTNTIYFFSSRQAKPSTNNPWLIGGREMKHDDQSALLLPVNQVDGIIESVKSKYSSYNMDSNSMLSAFRTLNILETKEFALFTGYCLKIIKLFITEAGKTSTRERSDFRDKISQETTIELFKKMGVFATSIVFKDVFKLTETKLNLYAVDELSGEDYKKVKGKSSDSEDKPLWCDLIVNHLLSKHPDCISIHLFLHDKDISGFSSDSLTHVGTVSECEAKGLISKHIAQALQNKQLTITFFKHDNPEIVKLIGTNAKIDGIKERLYNFFQERNEYKKQQERPKKHLIEF